MDADGKEMLILETIGIHYEVEPLITLKLLTMPEKN